MPSTDLVPARLPETAVVQMASPNALARLEPVPGQVTYVRNPHLTNTVASALMVLVAAGSTAWAVAIDNRYAGLLLAVTFLLVGLTVGFLRAFNAWDNDCTQPADPS